MVVLNRSLIDFYFYLHLIQLMEHIGMEGSTYERHGIVCQLEKFRVHLVRSITWMSENRMMSESRDEREQSIQFADKFYRSRIWEP